MSERGRGAYSPANFGLATGLLELSPVGLDLQNTIYETSCKMKKYRAPSKEPRLTFSGKVRILATCTGTATSSIRRLGSGEMTVLPEKSTRFPDRLPRKRPSHGKIPVMGWNKCRVSPWPCGVLTSTTRVKCIHAHTRTCTHMHCRWCSGT